jgi:hypothetical protein
MKKLALLLSALFIVALASAQVTKDEVSLMQASFGKDKKAMMAEFVQVDSAQKDAFWQLYDTYEAKRQDLGKRRIDLLEEYVNNFSKMTNDEADLWTKKSLSLGLETDDLLFSYYNRIKDVTNPVVALQFYQMEMYILTVIRLNILEALPFPERKK